MAEDGTPENDIGLSVRGLSVRYSAASSAAIDSVDLELRPGEMLAVLGGNGSGKSTLVLATAGALARVSGHVVLDGREMTGPAPAAIQVLCQSLEDQVVAPVVRDDVAFAPQVMGLPPDEVDRRTRSALTAVGLEGYDPRDVQTLSGGELARLALAGALAAGARYLLADEVTAHLDPSSADDILRLLRSVCESGVGVLLITHRLEEARYAERALMLHQGRARRVGAPRELLYDEELLSACGLKPPPIVSVARARGGRSVMERAPLSVDELVEAMCHSSN